VPRNVDDLGMDAAAFQSSGPRGAPRLLSHCQALGRVIDQENGTAWVRLEHELGKDLAHLLLVGLLAGGWGRTGSVV
jgi:hypothetical protein